MPRLTRRINPRKPPGGERRPLLLHRQSRARPNPAAGNYAHLLPHDIHRPCCQTKTEAKVKKVVVKYGSGFL